MEFKNLEMVIGTKDTSKMAINKVKENSFGEMEWFMKVILILVIWRAWELLKKEMVLTLVSFIEIKKLVKTYFLTRKLEDLRAS